MGKTYGLSIITGAFFTFIGTLQLFGSSINADIDKHVADSFEENLEVFPFHSIYPWKLTATNYRLYVGVIHFVCGLLLMVTSGVLSLLANFVLMFMMCGAVYTHWALEDDPGKMAPAIVCLTLLTLRLLLQCQPASKQHKLD